MESNDYSLIQGIKNKDKTSLCKLMDSYGKLVIYISSKILNAPYEKEFIDECYNDVFTTIWFNIDCFNEEFLDIIKYFKDEKSIKILDYKEKKLSLLTKIGLTLFYIFFILLALSVTF